MKRFHSPLARVLRLRQQSERMARMQVACARSELNAAGVLVAAARQTAARQSAALEVRLLQPGGSLMIEQAQLELAAAARDVQERLAEQSTAAEKVKACVEAYRAAQREREVAEKAVARHRDEHRRTQARAAAVELQEWAMRPKPSTTAADREEWNDA